METMSPVEFSRFLKSIIKYIVFSSPAKRDVPGDICNIEIIAVSKREVLRMNINIKWAGSIYTFYPAELDRAIVVEVPGDKIDDVDAYCDDNACHEYYKHIRYEVYGEIAIVIDPEDGYTIFPLLSAILKHTNITRRLLRPM